MKYYVILDSDDGTPYLVEEVGEHDLVLVGPVSLFEAECELERACADLPDSEELE